MPSFRPFVQRTAFFAGSFAFAATATAGTPKLPRLPERTGELVACPTQEVLATRFSTQNDMNGGGFGYYSASYDANRQPSIVNPKEQGVVDYINDEAAGRIPTADEKLTFLWGLRCAYPELEYVKTGFESVRAKWLADTGVSEETESAWHTLEADHQKSGKQQGASCPSGDAWHPENPALLARQYVLCGGLSAPKAMGNLLDALDIADDDIVAAGVVVQCGAAMPKSGDGRSANGAYWDWKMCQRIASRFDRQSLDAALKAADVSDWVRLSYQVKVETARASLDRLAPGFATFEKGWPSGPKMFDATVAQVDEKYVPLLEKWGPTLDAVDLWVEELRGGPGFAEGCADRWGDEIRRYIKESGVAPKGTALWDTIRDPIGVGLLEAYGLCRSQTGFASYGEMIAQDVAAGAYRVTRWHRGFADALRANARGDGTFNGEKLNPDISQARLSVQFEQDVARAWLRVPEKAKDNPFSYEETVSAISVSGDTATITFPKRSGTATIATDCSPDYSHIARIDEYGKFWYDWKCAGSKQVSVNETFRPIEIPAWQATGIAAGVKVAVDLAGQGTSYRVEEGGSTPVKGDVVWVKKGSDIIAACGFGVL